MSYPASLSELTRHPNDHPKHVDLIQPEVGGGRFTVSDVRGIKSIADRATIRVSGLDQSAFEVLIDRFGTRLAGIELWKCPRVSDLTPLEVCKTVSHIAIYWNQRVTRLWNFKNTPALRGLRFQDFSRLRTLEDLRDAAQLEELEFGDAVWSKNVFESLDPLAGLTNLRSLHLHPKGIVDDRVTPLASLQRLETFECPANLFTTEQYAWLKARLPPSVRGFAMGPTIKLESPLLGDKDVLIVGKRKPWLSSRSDRARIDAYVERYWSLVDRYREDPTIEPN